MATLKLKLIKSSNGCNQRQLGTLKAIGFKKTNSVVEKESTPQLLGMIERVKHLIIIDK